MENLSLNAGAEEKEARGPDEGKANEEGIGYVQVLGASCPPLADGKYDAIVLSTGMTNHSVTSSVDVF